MAECNPAPRPLHALHRTSAHARLTHAHERVQRDLLPASESLKQLAEAYGVSTEYWDYHGNLASPSSATLRAVLAALGVSINSEEEIGRALREVEDAPWRQALAPTVVVELVHVRVSALREQMCDGAPWSGRGAGLHSAITPGNEWVGSGRGR